MSEQAPRTDRHTARRRAGRVPRWVWLVVAVVVLGWLAVAAWRVMEAESSARSGLDALEEVRGTATGDLSRFIDSIGDQGPSGDGAAGAGVPGEKEVVVPLREAASDFSDARDQVDSPVMAPLRVLPWVGRQIRSVSALSAAAATTADAAADAYEALEEESRSSVATPEERLASVDRTTEILDDLADRVVGLDLGPGEALVGPLARARERFATEYQLVEQTVQDAATAANGVRAFLTGPNRYLVVAANNAEMRAGSGMFLQAGPMEIEGGRLSLGDMRPTDGLLLVPPGVPLDPDVEALWSWASPGREIRNTNLTPRFDEAARMTADIWEANGGGATDGVVSIDVVGLRELLEVTGPVTIDVGTIPGLGSGGKLEVDADNVEELLLVEQYAALGEDAAARRELMGQVAKTTFDAFNERSMSASSLLEVFREAGRGRHLMLWSSDEVQQAGWEALGASGEVSEDELLVGVLNRNGTKLDRYLKVEATLSAAKPRDGLRRVDVVVTVTNDAPEDLPTYVEGPYPGLGYSAGDYGGLVSLTVPASAGNFAATADDGTKRLRFSGDDGKSRVMVADLDLPRGTSRSITFSFEVPDAFDEVQVSPSARVPPVRWTAGAEEWSDTEPRTISLAALA